MSKVVLSINASEEGFPVTEFDDFCYAGLCSFNGKLLGCSADGVFAYEGDDDDGVDVASWFEIATTDFGVLNHKRLRSVLCSGLFSGDMVVSIAMDDGSYVDYPVNESTLLNQSTWKQGINREQRGAHVKVKVSNIDGADFSIDAMDAVVILLHNLPMSRTLALPRARAEVYGVLDGLVGAMEIS
jgi:hypothetical protein